LAYFKTYFQHKQLKLVSIYLFYLKTMIMKTVFFEDSLGDETIEVLGFKTIDALETN